MTMVNHIDPGGAEPRGAKPDQSGSTAPAAFQAKNAEIASMLARLDVKVSIYFRGRLPLRGFDNEV